MQPFNSIPFATTVRTMLLVLVLVLPQAVRAEIWHAIVGDQSGMTDRLGLAFLPNELWIHAGDSVTWAFNSIEPHTVSFLPAGMIRPLSVHDSDVITPNGSSFDGSSYVNSGEQTIGQTFTVKFPTAGNFKLTCLAHIYMSGAVHVLNPAETLPHDQSYYDAQAASEARELLDRPDLPPKTPSHSGNRVIVGFASAVATGEGVQALQAVRFLPDTITIDAGETVEWTILDLEGPHSVTFGFPIEPSPPRLPAPIVASGVGVNENLDSDGASHGIVASPTDNVHSGQLRVPPVDRAANAPYLPTTFTQLMQFPLARTVRELNQRFRVTFPNPGTYKYRCIYHDFEGMTGQVIVRP